MITVQFNNFDEVFDKCVKSASAAIAVKITNQAKALAHVGNYPKGSGQVGGRLRNSLMYKAHSQTGGFNDSSGAAADRQIAVTPKEFEAFVGTAVYYAHYEEFGTRHRAPHPFLRPAILIYTGTKGALEVKSMIDKEMKQGRVIKGEKRVFD